MLLSLLSSAAILAAQDTISMTLPQAVARAEAVSPAIAAATGAVAAARGLRSEIRWPFPDDPIVEFGRVSRRSTTTTFRDQQWSISQVIEIAGQWALRSGAAAALVRSQMARAEDARRLVALETRRAYVLLAVAERRAALTDSAAAFGERLAALARRQFETGESNRLEWNASVLEAARARSVAERARGESVAAAADLARLLALPPDSLVRTAGVPPAPTLSWGRDADLIATAIEHRADLRAVRERLRSSNGFLAASSRARIPDLSVSVFGGREADTDRLLGVAFGLRIPLLHRQQAAIGTARSELAAATAEAGATERAVQADVLAASARFRRAQAAEQRFVVDVLRAASENVALTERALVEGEASVTDVLVLRGTAVGAQLEYLEVVRAVADAWFDLAAALGIGPDDLATLFGGGR